MADMIDKLAWTPVRNRKVLFVRSRGQTLFYCGGGKRNPGETDEQALVREIEEELSVGLVPKSIKHTKTFYGPAHGGGEMKMACYEAEHIGNFVPANEVEEFEWFTTADKHRTTPMGVMILDWFHDNGFID